MKSYIPRCLICGKHIVRMRKIKVWDGYYLAFNVKIKYCSKKCKQRAFRRNRKQRILHTMTGL